MKKILTGFIIFSLLLFLVVLSGCTFEKTIKDTESIQKFSDPITENILTAINLKNYENYIKDFDSEMKKASTLEAFKSLGSLLRSKVGDYESKEFSKATESKGYTIVYYKAKYTKEPKGVTVKVVFSKIDSKIQVSGLWFDSPNLRK